MTAQQRVAPYSPPGAGGSRENAGVRHLVTTISKVQFQPKWKEELVCTMDGRSFVVELTMGILTVYFPTQSKWEASAPDWARHQWERVRKDLSAWCEQQKMPLVIEDHAWVQFE